jgi:hypothetical protein
MKVIKKTLKDGTIKEYAYDKIYDKQIPPSMICSCGKALKTKYSRNKHIKTKIHFKKLEKLKQIKEADDKLYLESLDKIYKTLSMIPNKDKIIEEIARMYVEFNKMK